MAVTALGGCLLLAIADFAAAQGRPPSPQDFAMASAQSDAYEVAAARVAEVETRSAPIRQFAKLMIHDHTIMSEALKGAASKSGLPPVPDTPNADQARMLQSLQSLKGPDFDREYVTQQVIAHQAALSGQEQYAAGGTDNNLRRAAAAAAPMVRHHLDVAKQLRSSTPR